MSRRESILKYLTPNTSADGLDRFKRSFCIPDNAEWLGVFMGAIYPLTLPDSWELHGSVTPDEAALVFKEIFDDAFYAIGECEGMTCCPLRYTENGLVEQYNPETSEYELIAYPAVPARTPIVGQDTDCLAAANATEVMSQLWQSWKTTWDTSSFLVAVAGIITIIGLLIFYPVALPFVITFFTELYALMEAIGADDFDADKQEILTCILFCNSTITDGVVTFNYDNVVSEVDALWTPVTDINVWAAIHYLLLIIGEDGLNRAGTTTSITSYDCACTDCPWCFLMDFTTSNGGFEAYAGRASYGAFGWSTGSLANIIQIQDLSMTSFIVTEIEVHLSGTLGGSGLWDLRANSVSGDVYSQSYSGNNTFKQVWTLPTPTTISGLWLSIGCSLDPVCSVGRQITKIYFRGIGTNPFGEENCE